MFSVLLVTSMITLFATSIVLLWRLTERNVLQRTLTRIMGILFILFVFVAFKMIRRLASDESVVVGVLNFDSIVLGFVALFAGGHYYIVAAHRNILTTRNSLIFLSPALLVFAFYVVWHWATDTPLFYMYTSMTELFNNFWTVPVMLRILLLLFFVTYVVAMHVDLWMIASLHEKHKIMNAEDAVSNVKCLRRIVIGIAAISFCYLILLFHKGPLVLLLYTVVVVIVCFLFVDIALTRRFYSKDEGNQLTWSIRGGWKIVRNTPAPETRDTPQTVGEGVDQPLDISISDAELLQQFDNWMESEKLYCESSFSAKSVVAMYRSIGYVKLNELLSTRGENIQSCIRRCRIQEACRRIDANPQISLRMLSHQVGFMQQSSFSRAFQVVTAITPTRYAQAVVDNKQ